MNAKQEAERTGKEQASGSEIPVKKAIPTWEQIPVEKRQELTGVLAGMLLKQVQARVVRYERAA